ncbi:MAG: hypothetical protein CMG46_01685 [Candidatus Marinimicrobia bacterium]|nr:hypothetical protein [Candidatus Neomarinimicrobiota bacterium]
MDPKDINKTNFCNKDIDNIISNELKEYILNDLKLRTNLDIRSRYAKIYNKHYNHNFKNPHLICLKTHGSPYYLYCTKINNVNYALLIDKKVKKGYDYPKMFLVQYRFDNILFNGTLFETELIRTNTNEWFLLIGDIYYFNNALLNESIIDRVNIIHDILNTKYINDSFSNICSIQVKRYFTSNDKDYIFNTFIPALNYTIRGIYIIPLNPNYSNILYFFTDDDLKDTKSLKSTYNFKVIKTTKPEVYELYINSNNNITKIGYAYIQNIEKSKTLVELFKANTEVIMKCKYNTYFNKWEPISTTNELIDNINDLKEIN